MERESEDLRIDAIQTRWSLVRNAHSPGAAQSAEDARRMLVMRYIPAIRRYVGAIVKDAEEADDLAQDFAMRLMKGDSPGPIPIGDGFVTC